MTRKYEWDFSYIAGTTPILVWSKFSLGPNQVES